MKPIKVQELNRIIIDNSNKWEKNPAGDFVRMPSQYLAQFKVPSEGEAEPKTITILTTPDFSKGISYHYGEEAEQDCDQDSWIQDLLKATQETPYHQDLHREFKLTTEEGKDSYILTVESRKQVLEHLAQNKPQPKQIGSLGMTIVGSFIAALGIAAVALAFTILNVLTMGTFGLVALSTGVAALVSGVGLFAASLRKDWPANTPDLCVEQAESCTI